MKTKCIRCNGSGSDMIGVSMHPNPSSYSDYDEIWGDCEHCNGSGQVPVSIKQWLKITIDSIKEAHGHLVEETVDEIPF